MPVNSSALLTPRYLAALGLDPEGKFAYIVGGYGSQTGDRMLDPQNYYDLFRYDIKAKTFKILYTLTALSTPFTFLNSMVVCWKPGAWYSLIFLTTAIIPVCNCSKDG